VPSLELAVPLQKEFYILHFILFPLARR